MAVENKPIAQAGQSGQPGVSAKPAQSQPQSQDKPEPQSQSQQSGSGSDPDSGEGVRATVQESFRLRTEVPGRPDVDARLDNRAGRFRPPVEEWPAKPQQVDGPDLPGQIEHTRRTFKELEDDGADRKGMYSPGPHGLSDEALRQGDTAYGPEGLSEAGPGSKG